MKGQLTKLRIALTALVLTAVGGFAFAYWASYRQVAFDAAVWRTSPSTSLAKYRMSEDLLRTVETKRWTANETITALGPDDNHVVPFAPGRMNTLSYRFRVPVKPTSKILQLMYDANGNLVDASIVPD